MTEQTTALTAPKAYQDALESAKYRERLDLMLAGTDVTTDRFIGMVVQSLARSPKLLAPDIDRESLLLAVLTAAEMGLVPTGAFGGGWLVPFREHGVKKVQFMTDWRAFIKMAFRSGQLRGAWAHPVYEGEPFEVQLGSAPRIVHEYGQERDANATVTHVYAVAHLTTGERVFEVMTRAEIEAVRQKSRAKDDGPWVTDWLEMARKTVIRRLFKYLPVAITPQLAAALEAEDAWESEPPRATVAPVSDRRARVLAEVGVEPQNGDGTPESPAAGPATSSEAAPSLIDDGLPEMKE